MKIYADLYTSEFKVLGLESGFFFGRNDVLKGTKSEVHHHSFTVFKGEIINSSITGKPKMYIHISKNMWSFFTGKLREYTLSWRWKVAYLDPKDGNNPIRILVCTNVKGCLSDYLKDNVLGKSWFQTYLTYRCCYSEYLEKEFLYTCDHNSEMRTIEFVNFLGHSEKVSAPYKYHHIFRSRSIYSTIKYLFLKHFSNTWKEVIIPTPLGSYNILIKKEDEANISTLKIIK